MSLGFGPLAFRALKMCPLLHPSSSVAARFDKVFVTAAKKEPVAKLG